MPSVILHVGPHKTGSTYLQTCFHHCRATLRERGIVVPSGLDHSPGNYSHTALVQAVSGDGEPGHAGDVIEAAFAQTGETGRVLISAEDLSTLQIDALRRLRGLLADATVTIVFYVRRWSDILPSIWQEQIKQGHSFSFPEFLCNHLRNPDASPVLNLALRLTALEDAFGRESLRLVCYSTLCDGGHDLFTHFAARFLNWPNASSPPGQMQPNRSRDIGEIDLLRRLNALEQARTGQRPVSLRGCMDMAWSRLDTAPVLTAMAASRRIQVFNDRAPALHRLHTELRERYDANTVRPCPPKLFFKPQRREIEYIGDDYLLRPGVADAVRVVHAQIVGKEGLLF